MSTSENWRESLRFRDTPREQAIRHLDSLIADGKAGLDCYDAKAFIAIGEPVKTINAIVKTGELLAVSVDGDGEWRVRASLNADVRRRLGLDEENAPVIVEPLASRRVDG